VPRSGKESGHRQSSSRAEGGDEFHPLKKIRASTSLASFSTIVNDKGDLKEKTLMKITDFTVKDRQEQPVSLKAYEGKVLLLVNTATGCGYTPQYAGLEELYEKYKAQGFEILDFPCNQFANQAPGSNEEIHEFCALNTTPVSHSLAN
jgi:hypothetical protein